ncbi:TMEM175 family protein [Massilia terrae]|uniref:TMEM175 family protein n=1 Tax=Massilia terrae TaxID=1811224 RepID=A0ABT2D0M5_9BURK|nr:TMEM175 family protein [Massilia terrae]MCS0659605.1 TMEM175 family protein [Massilia terrae]
MNETPSNPAHLSKHRLEALIDGIFAVVMTLLVIDLRLPERARDLDEAGVRRALVDLLPNFESWVISFLVLAIFWVANHRLYSHVRQIDSKLIRFTMLMLAGASLLPFAAAVNAQSSTQIGQIVYGAVLVTMGLALLLMWRHIYRNPELCVHPVDAHTWHAACVRASGMMLISLLTIPLAYALPGKANIAFGLMFLVRPVAEHIATRMQKPAPLLIDEEPEAPSQPA